MATKREKKGRMFDLRLSSREHAMLRTLARLDGVSMAHVIRALIRDKARRIKP